MKFEIKNLGQVRQAELTLGDLTVVCGKNNMGKTYIAYAIYGFLFNWQVAGPKVVPSKYLETLVKEGAVTIPLEQLAKHAKKIFDTLSSEFSRKDLRAIFAGREKLFEKSSVTARVEAVDDYKSKSRTAMILRNPTCRLKKDAGKPDLQIFGSFDADKLGAASKDLLESKIQKIVADMLFENQMPNTFIASTERTGATMFQRELDFTRSRLFGLLGEEGNTKLPLRLLGEASAHYSIPVRANIDFVRDVPNIAEKASKLSEKHPNLLRRFRDIIGGEYHVTPEGDVRFVPNSNKRVKLSMTESSSAVRSLMVVGLYLRHMAKPGDLLVIDEPELNLHPENQRLVARLLAMLVNHGIKVFITTHSDYIIRELNTLIMLHETKKRRRLAKLPCRKKYDPLEFLSRDKLKVYMTQEESGPVGRKSSKAAVSHTLVPADVNENGISLASFDDTIRDINRIQDQLIWGE